MYCPVCVGFLYTYTGNDLSVTHIYWNVQEWKFTINFLFNGELYEWPKRIKVSKEMYSSSSSYGHTANMSFTYLSHK